METQEKTIEQLRAEKEQFDKELASEIKKSAKITANAKKAAAKESKPAKPKKAKQVKRATKLKGPTGAGIKALTLAKERYKAAGHPTNCGDWLALTLEEHFVSKEKGKKKVFDFDDFLKCCRENGLDTKEKWANTSSPGFQGRVRMNGRQKLEIVIAREGHLLIDGKKIKPTGVFLKRMEKEHPEQEPVGDDDPEND